MTIPARSVAPFVAVLAFAGVARAEPLLCVPSANGPPTAPRVTLDCIGLRFCDRTADCAGEQLGATRCDRIAGPSGPGICRPANVTLIGCDQESDCPRVESATAHCVRQTATPSVGEPPMLCEYVPTGPTGGAIDYCDDPVGAARLVRCYTPPGGTAVGITWQFGDCDGDRCPNGGDATPCEAGGACGPIICGRLCTVPDGGVMDAGVDGGPRDAGLDGGVMNAGIDGGVMDASARDASSFDASARDAGAPAVGFFDAATPQGPDSGMDQSLRRNFRGGGGCVCSVGRRAESSGWWLVAGAGAACWSRRRRTRV